jgi:xylem cysteine proteinase
LAALAMASVVPYENMFLDFIEEYGKVYAHVDEMEERFAIFKSNVDRIMYHNSQDLPWTLDVNEWADMTWEEFSEGRLGLEFDGGLPEVSDYEIDLATLVNAEAEIDWVSRGYVTDVKNQGQCGSCWAFSSTGSIEGAAEIKEGRLTSLSEQQLVDCSTQNSACNGGLMDYAFEDIQKELGGLCNEDAYPYKGRKGSCQTSCQAVAQISGYNDVAEGSDAAMIEALQNGPVAVAIEADQFSFQFYNGGVMTGRCGSNLDHGVLLVGYGTDNGKDYYKIKNSWGSRWGEKGYIRIGRGDSYGQYGQCGVLAAASQPTA